MRMSPPVAAAAPGTAPAPAAAPPAVLRLNGIDRVALALLLGRYGIQLTLTAHGEPIPGSYWGDTEAGLREDRLYARLDTPLHSVLHEASHYVCMTPERRVGLDRDAGGDDLEETAVCYLQVLLADALPRIGRDRLFADMDAWGYSFDERLLLAKGHEEDILRKDMARDLADEVMRRLSSL